MIFDELNELTEVLAKLPNLTQNQAKRLASLLLHNNNLRIELITCLNNLSKIQLCNNCNLIKIANKCIFCDELSRNRTKLCIVSSSHNINRIESLNSYNGLYYLINIDSIKKTKDNYQKTINSIIDFIKKMKFSEIIIAMNPTSNDQIIISKIIHSLNDYFPKIKLTRLAFGIPAGLKIEYADAISLKESFLNRKVINEKM